MTMAPDSVGMSLAGQGAIVTGGGGGLGREVVLMLVERGAAVLAADIDPEGLKQTQSLAADGSLVIPFVGDVSLEATVEDMAMKAKKSLPTVDLFHNNVGVGSQFRPVAAMDYAEFQRVMRINIDSIFLGLRYVMPHMLAAGRGSIVNTASIASFVSPPGRADYVASKHAVMGLTRTAAVEGAEHNVRVNAVCPGPMDTPMIRRAAAKAKSNSGPTPREQLEAFIPMHRYGDPREVARAVLFLLSDWASYITGAALVVDGGLLSLQGGQSW